jgi:hypothetical protein
MQHFQKTEKAATNFWLKYPRKATVCVTYLISRGVFCIIQPYSRLAMEAMPCTPSVPFFRLSHRMNNVNPGIGGNATKNTSNIRKGKNYD